MIIKNSLKQMFRTPLKTFLFFLLITVSAVLFVLGLNIFWLNQRDAGKFEDTFITIGTIEQKPTKTDIEKRWDAGNDQYWYRTKAEYGPWLTEEALDFEGVDYIYEPVKRPYFLAYEPEMTLKWEDPDAEGEDVGWLIVAEVTALKTGPLDELPAKITKILSGSQTLVGKEINICEHTNPEPESVEEGKTYIMQLNGPFTTHDAEIGNVGELIEYIPISQDNTQYTKEGEQIGESGSGICFAEVTEGFYETEQAKRWLATMEEVEISDCLLPVQPIDATNLLMAFHEKNATIQKGRDIEKEEYEQGKRVCLIPQTLAAFNGLEVGDMLNLPLLIANYSEPPIRNYNSNNYGNRNFSLCNGKGEVYSVFDEHAYEIVGIYKTEKKDESDFGIAYNEVIIPYASVQNSWDDNIVLSGPMIAGTTSFQIPNGEIQHFRELWEKQDIQDLEIKFYDNGYSLLEETINNRRIMAVLFLAGGIIMAVLVLALFCHLFIAREATRTAIERSLGLKKKQCVLSLLSGLMGIVVIGAVAGSIVGCVLTGKTVEHLQQEQIYNTKYTSTSTNSGEAGEEIIEDQRVSLAETAATGAAGAVMLILFGGGIALVYMRGNLKKEPIMMLMGNEE